MRLLLSFILYFFMPALFAQKNADFGKTFFDSGYYRSFDGVKIYYEIHGKGKPVLLVHGFVVNSNSWKHTALYDSLLNEGYEILLPDLRGNGKSDKPHDSTAYDNDAEAKDLIGLISFLSIKKYSAIGYSRGSIITARLLVLDSRVQNAVMGGMGSDFTNPQWPRRIMFYRGLMGDSIPAVQGLITYIHQENLDQLALAYMQRSQPSTPKDALRIVSQPVLVIHGDKDSDNGSADDLATLFKHSVRAVTPGDHNHAAATPEFAKKVIDFLKNNHW